MPLKSKVLWNSLKTVSLLSFNIPQIRKQVPPMSQMRDTTTIYNYTCIYSGEQKWVYVSLLELSKAIQIELNFLYPTLSETKKN